MKQTDLVNRIAHLERELRTARREAETVEEPTAGEEGRMSIQLRFASSPCSRDQTQGSITTDELERVLVGFEKPLRDVQRLDPYLSVIKCLDECRLFVDRTVAGDRPVPGSTTRLYRRARAASSGRAPNAAMVPRSSTSSSRRWRYRGGHRRPTKRAVRPSCGDDPPLERLFRELHPRRGGAAFNREFNKLLQAHFARRFDEAELSTHEPPRRSHDARAVGKRRSSRFLR